MAANVTVAEVRYIGNWNAVDIPDADLDGIFIPAGDAWISLKLETTLALYTTANTNKGAIAKQAELYYVGYHIASRPTKEDFQVGPVRSARVKGDEVVAMAKNLKSLCKEMLGLLGLSWSSHDFTAVGGDSYHPLGQDDTNINMSVAQDDSDYPFNLMGRKID